MFEFLEDSWLAALWMDPSEWVLRSPERNRSRSLSLYCNDMSRGPIHQWILLQKRKWWIFAMHCSEKMGRAFICSCERQQTTRSSRRQQILALFFLYNKQWEISNGSEFLLYSFCTTGSEILPTAANSYLSLRMRSWSHGREILSTASNSCASLNPILRDVIMLSKRSILIRK